jgi:hypothetical protein
VAGGIVLAVGDDRLRQPLADVTLAAGARRAGAERSSLIDSRVVTVETKARGEWIVSPASTAWWTRRSDSWTTSSASATLPSIR